MWMGVSKNYLHRSLIGGVVCNVVDSPQNNNQDDSTTLSSEDPPRENVERKITRLFS